MCEAHASTFEGGSRSHFGHTPAVCLKCLAVLCAKTQEQQTERRNLLWSSAKRARKGGTGTTWPEIIASRLVALLLNLSSTGKEKFDGAKLRKEF